MADAMVREQTHLINLKFKTKKIMENASALKKVLVTGGNAGIGYALCQ